VRGEDFHQAHAAFEQVGERMTIEGGKEVVACLRDNFSEAAGSGKLCNGSSRHRNILPVWAVLQCSERLRRR
jgi:hypothetical protein